ncbi:MAG: hypothetical protein AAF989_01135 [Planctomycetota bacterium]
MTSSSTASIFERLESLGDRPLEVANQLVQHFRQSGKPVELFEAIKMATRLQMGLKAVALTDEPKLSPEVERQLEDGLLQGCREAGGMMIRQGRLMEGWMYLRPVGDRELVRRLLADVEFDDDNYDAMIQILVHEQVDVGRGYAAVLEHQGTCNSITLYEQTISQLPRTDQQAAAACLLDHFLQELTSLVRLDVQRLAPEDSSIETMTLGELLVAHPVILEGGGYHLDTTHLASVVRIASVLESASDWQKALDLTEYGRRLDQQFQYPGDEPFVDFYPAYGTLYRTLLGKNVNAGLQLFERRARTVEVAQHGTAAIETYIELLARMGRHQMAIQQAVQLMPDDVPTQSVLARLLEWFPLVEANQQDATRDLLQDFCCRRDDPLGFAAVAGSINDARGQ